MSIRQKGCVGCHNEQILFCKGAYPIFLPRSLITSVYSISLISNLLMRSENSIAGISFTIDFIISSSHKSKSFAPSEQSNLPFPSSTINPAPMRRSLQDRGFSIPLAVSMATSTPSLGTLESSIPANKLLPPPSSAFSFSLDFIVKPKSNLG